MDAPLSASRDGTAKPAKKDGPRTNGGSGPRPRRGDAGRPRSSGGRRGDRPPRQPQRSFQNEHDDRTNDRPERPERTNGGTKQLKVILLNVNYDTEWPALKQHVRDTISTGFGRVNVADGTGTVEFRNPDDAADAAKALDGTTLDGRTLRARLENGQAPQEQQQKTKRKAPPGPVTAESLDAEMDNYAAGRDGGQKATEKKPRDDAKRQRRGPVTAADLDADMDAYHAAAAAGRADAPKSASAPADGDAKGEDQVKAAEETGGEAAKPAGDQDE